MAKIATKFVANVVVKVGRQSMDLKFPADFTDVEGDLQGHLDERIGEWVRETLRIKVSNLSDLKKAFKAYQKAFPEPADDEGNV